jgi:phospholipase C
LKYLGISRSATEFFTDCALGTLPQVSYLDPRFIDEGSGTSGDDHPHADIRNGEAFLNAVYTAITKSPAWENTVLVLNFDEWGGFFDHVPPPEAEDDDPNCRLRGFRVPTIVISPFARRHHVAHDVYDHTSILKLIEWRWQLAPLSTRDETARNLAEVLQFGAPDLTAPSFRAPLVHSHPCPTPHAEELASWHALASQATTYGFGPGSSGVTTAI